MPTTKIKRFAKGRSRAKKSMRNPAAKAKAQRTNKGGPVKGQMSGLVAAAEIPSGLVSGMPDDDDAVLVHDEGLAEAEVLDGFGDDCDSMVVNSRVAGG